MPERISRFRQVRILLNPARADWSEVHWDVVFLTVNKGVPHARMINSGIVAHSCGLPTAGSVAEVLEALGRAGLGV